MTPPRLILLLGPVPAGFKPGTIVIDHYYNCFWKDGERRPGFQGSKYGQTGRGFRILAALIIRSPGIVHFDEMIEHVWGDDWNGGPGDPNNYLHSVLKVRKHVEMSAWIGGYVASIPWRGFQWVWGERTNRRLSWNSGIRGRPRKRVLIPHADTRT